MVKGRGDSCIAFISRLKTQEARYITLSLCTRKGGRKSSIFTIQRVDLRYMDLDKMPMAAVIRICERSVRLIVGRKKSL